MTMVYNRTALYAEHATERGAFVPMLIDGHNLIGANVFDDIRLTDEDDEARLVARLRAWRGRYAGKIEVIFDHGITEGRSSLLSGGGVEVRFARNPTDADDLIRRRVRHPQKNLILVTNDAALRQEAERHHVEVWRSDEFVDKMFEIPVAKPKAEAKGKHTVELSDKDVDAWMQLFQNGNGLNQDNPTWTPPFKPTKRRRPNPPPHVRSQRKITKKNGKRKR
jgi:predicted RNA-binding protein with PIN domain